jgi:DNA polymerase-3 subunit delta'
MRFGEIFGQKPAIDLLRRALRSGRLPHALLFHGPEGVGKGTTARALASALLCQENADDACGRCEACLKMRHRSHPDLLVVRRLSSKIKEAGPMDDAPEPRAGEKGSSELSSVIRIFQIRQLAEHATYAPREGRFRVFIIDPADRMNQESQNALLKTLEEPPSDSILILVASRPHLLLPTVRSRCLAVGFSPLPADELAALLERTGVPEDEAMPRAALSEGRPGRALELDLDSLRAQRDRLMTALTSLAGAPDAVAELPALAADLAGKDEASFLEGLSMLESLLRDAARSVAGGSETILHRDLDAPLASLGKRLGSERAGELIGAVERVRGELRFNLNRTLAAESLLAAVAGGPLP